MKWIMSLIDSSQKKKHRLSVNIWKAVQHPLFIKEMKIITILRLHLYPIRMVIIKKTKNKRWQEYKIIRCLINCWWMQIIITTMGVFVEVPPKQKHRAKMHGMPHNTTLGQVNDSNDSESAFYRNMCTSTFMALLIKILRNEPSLDVQQQMSW